MTTQDPTRTTVLIVAQPRAIDIGRGAIAILVALAPIVISTNSWNTH